MASSPNEQRPCGLAERCLLLVGAGALAVVLAAALFAPCKPAFADEGQPNVEVTSVQASLLGASQSVDIGDRQAALQMGRLAPLALDAACSPEVIQAGVDCGMEWMCGIQPCLCGSADAWGGCSCNGIADVRPDVAFSSSDEGVVRVAQAFGRTWLVPVGPGQAQVTATPSLRYHASCRAQVEVTVSGVHAADVRLCAAAAALVALVGAAVAAVFALRKRKGWCSR